MPFRRISGAGVWSRTPLDIGRRRSTTIVHRTRVVVVLAVLTCASAGFVGAGDLAIDGSLHAASEWEDTTLRWPQSSLKVSSTGRYASSFGTEVVGTFTGSYDFDSLDFRVSELSVAQAIGVCCEISAGRGRQSHTIIRRSGYGARLDLYRRDSEISFLVGSTVLPVPFDPASPPDVLTFVSGERESGVSVIAGVLVYPWEEAALRAFGGGGLSTSRRAVDLQASLYLVGAFGSVAAGGANYQRLIGGFAELSAIVPWSPHSDLGIEAVASTGGESADGSTSFRFLPVGTLRATTLSFRPELENLVDISGFYAIALQPERPARGENDLRFEIHGLFRFGSGVVGAMSDGVLLSAPRFLGIESNVGLTIQPLWPVISSLAVGVFVPRPGVFTSEDPRIVLRLTSRLESGRLVF